MPWRATEIELGLPYGTMHPDPAQRPQVKNTGRRLELKDGKLRVVNGDGSPYVPKITSVEHVPISTKGGELHSPLERHKREHGNRRPARSRPTERILRDRGLLP